MGAVFTSERERRLWGLVAACVLLIYGSLYVARPVAEGLRSRGLLRATVVACFALAGIAIVGAVLRRRPGRLELATLVGAAVVYALVLSRFPVPEERLHLLEYGLVGGLAYAALLERWRARAREGPPIDGAAAEEAAPWGPALEAAALTGILGWSDEGIQALLPNRVYDLRDVAFNLLAGILAIAAIRLAAWARRRDSAARAL